MDLIKHIFNERDSDIILRIPLASSLPNDVYVWHYNSSGVSTIKFAYQVEMNFMVRGKRASSSSGSNILWKRRTLRYQRKCG